MGARPTEFYERTGKEFGFEGRLKLALLTAIPSTRADAEADSAENLQKFEQVFLQIRQTQKK